MKDIELFCRGCDKRMPHRWEVGGCKCLECSTTFDPHRRSKLRLPEPGPPLRSYDGGMVPQNWREIVAVLDQRIDKEIDNALVALAGCTCDTLGEMECSSCEAVECALEEMAVNSMFVARRNSFYTQWERQRDTMSEFVRRLQEAGYVGNPVHRETSTR